MLAGGNGGAVSPILASSAPQDGRGGTGLDNYEGAGGGKACGILHDDAELLIRAQGRSKEGQERKGGESGHRAASGSGSMSGGGGVAARRQQFAQGLFPLEEQLPERVVSGALEEWTWKDTSGELIYVLRGTGEPRIPFRTRLS